MAGGLATAAGLDPTLVRMGMAVGALTGWAILAYLIAWAVIPEEDEAAGRTLGPAPEDRRPPACGSAWPSSPASAPSRWPASWPLSPSPSLGTIGALFDPFIDPFAGDFGGFNPDFPVRGMPA